MGDLDYQMQEQARDLKPLAYKLGGWVGRVLISSSFEACELVFKPAFFPT